MISSKDNEVAAHVSMPSHCLPELDNTMCNTLAIDNFLQVAGLHVNSLKDCTDGEVYVATNIERIHPSAEFDQGRPTSWFVYSNLSRVSDRDVINDIYVFDSRTRKLVMVIHSVCFTKVLISALARTLSRANMVESQTVDKKTQAVAKTSQPVTRASTPLSIPESKASETNGVPMLAAQASDIHVALKKLINDITDVPMDSIQDQSKLEGLGIDSLMIHEVQSEIKSVFKADIPSSQLSDMDVSSLAQYLDSQNSSPARTRPSSPPMSRSPTVFSSPQSSADDSPATSIRGESPSASGPVSKLAKFVAEQLGTTVTMSRETCLADHGMDSLLSLELAGDIEREFGVQLDHGALTGSTTFGELTDMVIPPVALPAPAMTTTTTPTVIPETQEPPRLSRLGKMNIETVLWKETQDGTKLYADIYLPPSGTKASGKDWPVGKFALAVRSA